jgi:hypothetical protein
MKYTRVPKYTKMSKQTSQLVGPSRTFNDVINLTLIPKIMERNDPCIYDRS